LSLLTKEFSAGLFDFFKSDDEDHGDDSEWEKIFQDGEQVCGYLGGSATKVEDKLDNCYEEYVKESRVRMSIGFELCFGFNFGRLNNTVSKPLNYMQRIVNTRVLDLSLEVCVPSENIDRRPKLESGAVDIDKEQASIGHCKVFFDRVVDAIYAEGYSIEDVFKEYSDKLSERFRTSEIEKIQKEIRDLVHPVDECKVPEQTLKDNLIIKYTKKFLQNIVNPQMPSFNYENLDVLLHPEKYIVHNEEPDFPDFDEMVEKEKEEELHHAQEMGDTIAEEAIEDPTKRFVIMDDSPHDHEMVDDPTKAFVAMRGKPKHGGKVIMHPRAYGELPSDVKEQILRSDELIRNIETVLAKNPQMQESEVEILNARRQEELNKWWNANADTLYRNGVLSKEDIKNSVFIASTHKHTKGKIIHEKDAPENQWEPHDDTHYHEGSKFILFL
jgi:hypothetical protein